MGTPLVGLVHVAMGSFLSMQAYFGSTFLDGTGAVVGVGLLRNLATLMTGLTLSGLIACRLVPGRLGMGQEPATETRFSRRIQSSGCEHTRAPTASRSRPAGGTANRRHGSGLDAACAVGVRVGTVVGWQSAGSLMGLSSDMYFLMFYRMIWFRDVIGDHRQGPSFRSCSGDDLLLRGAAAGQASLLARPPAVTASGDCSGSSDLAVADRACRLPVVLAILIMNSSWFMLVYHAVPFYGPTLLAPPAPVIRRSGLGIEGPREGAKMSTRSSARDVWVGLIVIVAVAGLIASGQHGERRARLPGAAADHRRDLSRRPGHPHRQPGAGGRARHRQRGRRRPGGSRGDAARRVRISLPASLVKKLRQDVKVSIAAGA